jgi:hypothetical protein
MTFNRGTSYQVPSSTRQPASLPHSSKIDEVDKDIYNDIAAAFISQVSETETETLQKFMLTLRHPHIAFI